LLTLLAALFAAAAPSAQAAPVSGEYIVQFTPGEVSSAGARRAVVEHVGGMVTRDVRLINAVGAELTAAQVAALRADAAVEVVSRNGAVKPSAVTFDASKLATAFNQSAQTPDVWPASTGKGVGVAVIDTGISDASPDFRVSQADASSRVIARAAVNPNATNPDDGYGHGTLVAGILAGNSGYRAAGDPLRGRYSGAAPDANLVSVKIADDAGNATVLDAINGIQFAVDYKAELGIRIINLSFEANDPQSYKNDPLDAAVESAWFSGIVVVAAAGNRGTKANAVGYAPGNDPYAVTVGAVDDQATKATKDDQIATWSSHGTTQDGFAKPELYAPGAHIVANLAPGSAFSTLCPSCIRDGSYIQAGGTSLAAPIVAGVAALILQVHPDWTPDMVKGALVNTTRGIGASARELVAPSAVGARSREQTYNAGLTPNTLTNPATGAIDYVKASWTKASWTKASWTKASWTCVCTSGAGGIDPTKASWTKASWSTDWTK
jgi:serine protease AprX